MVPILVVVHEIQMFPHAVQGELAGHVEVGDQRGQLQFILQEPLLFFDAPDLKIIQELDEETAAGSAVLRRVKPFFLQVFEVFFLEKRNERRIEIPENNERIFIHEVQRIERRVLRVGQTGIRIPVGQQPPGEFLPVVHRRFAERNQPFHHKRLLELAPCDLLHVVSPARCTACVQVEAEVNPVFFEFREQIIKFVERLRVEGQRIGCVRIKQGVFEMMKADRVVAEPGCLGHEIVGKRLVEINRGVDQIGPEEPDPLLRRVAEGEMAVFGDDDRAVFAGRSVEIPGKVQHRSGNRSAVEFQRQIIFAGNDVRRAFELPEIQFAVAEHGACDHPGRIGSVSRPEGQSGRRTVNRKLREIKPDE